MYIGGEPLGRWLALIFLAVLVVRGLTYWTNYSNKKQEFDRRIFREHAELTWEKESRERKEREDLSKIIRRNELGQFLPKNKQ